MLRSLRNKNKFRGPASSVEFNEQVENLRKDTETMYNLLNKNEEYLSKNSSIIINEHLFLQQKIKKLEREIERIQDYANSESEDQLVYTNFYDAEHIQNNEEKPVTIDNEFGVAMPAPTHVVNKLSHLSDSGETIIPHDLEIIIEEEHAKRFRSEELSEKMKDIGMQEDDIFRSSNKIDNKDFENIVDTKRDTYWVRQVVANEHLELFGRIVIRVPKEGVTNLFSNTLTINPYPEGTMTIHSIMVKGLGNQWDLLENYPTKDGEPEPIKNIGKTFFNFPRKEITEIIINYSQPYFLENNEDRVFTYGFQGINLEYRLFTEDNNSFTTTIDLRDRGHLFDEVGLPEVVPAKGTNKNIEHLIENRLYYDETMQTEFDFNSTILPTVDRVFIETIMHQENREVPIIEELKLSYKTRE